jgi:hypothetical protein
MLANIKINYPDRQIEPTLKAVIEKVALAKPNLTFIHDVKNSGWYAGRSMARSNTNPPEGIKWATQFQVVDNGAPAGLIQIEHNNSRSATQEWRIGVRSHLVTNDGRRGTRGTTYTSNEAKAVSNAKKYFVGQTYGFVLYGKLSRAKHVATSAISSLTASVRHGQFLTNTVDAQILLHSYMTNRPINTQIDSAMRAKLDTPKFEQSLSEYQLARWYEWQHKFSQCRLVHHHEDGYLYYTTAEPNGESESHTALVTVSQYDDLPIAMQEKLAVLQLMKDSEIVKDVGQRVDDDTFWIAS